MANDLGLETSALGFHQINGQDPFIGTNVLDKRPSPAVSELASSEVI